MKKASAEEEWRYLGFFVHGNHRGQAGEDSVALGGDAGVVDVVQVVVGDGGLLGYPEALPAAYPTRQAPFCR